MAYLGYKNPAFLKRMREKREAEKKKESEVKPTKKEST